MSKQTFSIFQIFALYFPFCMRPYNARSSVTLERFGFVVREPQSHLELTYFLPKISAFNLISGNWANHTRCTDQYSLRPCVSNSPCPPRCCSEGTYRRRGQAWWAACNLLVPPSLALVLPRPEKRRPGARVSRLTLLLKTFQGGL